MPDRKTVKAAGLPLPVRSTKCRVEVAAARRAISVTRTAGWVAARARLILGRDSRANKARAARTKLGSGA